MIKEEAFIIKGGTISPMRSKSAGSDSSTPSTPTSRTLPTNLSPRSTALAAGMHDYVPMNPSVKAALHKRLSGQDLNAGKGNLNVGKGASGMVLDGSLSKLNASVPNSTSLVNTAPVGQQRVITTAAVSAANNRNIVLHMTPPTGASPGGVKTIDGQKLIASTAGSLLVTPAVITTIPQQNPVAVTTAGQLSQSAAAGLSAAKLSLINPYSYMNANVGGLLDPSLTGSEPPLSPQNVTLYPSDSVASTSNSTSMASCGGTNAVAMTTSTSKCNPQAISTAAAATSTMYTVTSPTLIKAQGDKQQVFVTTAVAGGSTVLQRAEAADVLVSVGRGLPPISSAPQTQTTSVGSTKSRRGRKRGSTSATSHNIPAKVAATASSRGSGKSSQSVQGSMDNQQEIMSMVSNVHQPLGISAIPSPELKGGASAGGEDGSRGGGRSHGHRRVSDPEHRSKR